MTNAQIVMMQAQKLAEEGVIKYTGRTMKTLTPAGEEVLIKEIEAIHTYQVWKDLGYQVQKGQKAVAKFPIWKYTAKQNKTTGEQEDGHMFLKTAAFFSQSQVEKI